MAHRTIPWELPHVFISLSRDYETHQKIRMEKYDLSEEKDEIHQYESEREDASSEDNNDKDDEDELYEI